MEFKEDEFNDCSESEIKNAISHKFMQLMLHCEGAVLSGFQFATQRSQVDVGGYWRQHFWKYTVRESRCCHGQVCRPKTRSLVH